MSRTGRSGKGRDAAEYTSASLTTRGKAAVVRAVRELNPRSRILVRAHYLREREELERSGATAAVFEEAEAAGTLYEAAAGLEPATPLALPIASSTTPASKDPRPRRAARFQVRLSLPFRADPRGRS